MKNWKNRDMGNISGCSMNEYGQMIRYDPSEKNFLKCRFHGDFSFSPEQYHEAVKNTEEKNMPFRMIRADIITIY